MNEPRKSPDLHAVLAISRRRRLTIIATLVSGFVATVLVALLLPPQYRSSGTVLIEQQEVPTDLVRTTITSYADQRIQVISQRVLTTQTLLGIVRRYDLYAADRDKISREDLIARMRKDIALDMISANVIDPRSGMPRAATIAFSLSYTSRSPEQAVKVANELSTLFLNENLTSRVKLTQEAATFIETEGDRIQAEIAATEKKLSEFKEKNAEALPEVALNNLAMRDRTEQQLLEMQTRRSTLEQQQVYLEAQLLQIKPHSMMLSETGEQIMSPTDRLKVLRSQIASAKALYGPNHPDIERYQREIAGLEAQGEGGSAENELARRLEQAQGERASAQERYGAAYPDVQRLDREIASLKEELAKQPEAKPATAAASVTSPDNPAYIQLQAQLSATRKELESLKGQGAKLHSQLDAYQRNLSLSPETEREYRDLARELDGAKAQYSVLRAKQMEATLAQNLESDRKGERFTLIEPPVVPTKPVSPNRGLIFVLGSVLTLLLAAGIVAAKEALDSRVRGDEDMRSILQLTPMALIPRIDTAADLAGRRRARRIALVAATASSLCVVVLVHFLVLPLDAVWDALMRRLGI